MLHWGIIGCGDVCEVKSGPAFSKVAGSNLFAVMRRDGDKAKDFASRHNVPRWYTAADDVISHPEINAIYIATPPSSHEMYVERALKAGKPIYVEKPVSLNVDSCQRMINLQKHFAGKVSVAHYRRGLSLFKKVKELIHGGVIGTVRLIDLHTLQPPSPKLVNRLDGSWRVIPEISGGGIFHDLAPHQLDIMYWIFGQFEGVNGFSLNQSNLYDAPDFTTLTATFSGGIAFRGVWAFNVAPEAALDRCVIVGDHGTVEFSFFKLGALHLTTTAGKETIPMTYPENIQLEMIDSVCRYFRGEGPNPCSLEEALETMTVIDAVSKCR